MIDYFTKYPLKTKKLRACQIWAQVSKMGS